MKPKNNIFTLTCKYFLKCFIASCHACQHILDLFSRTVIILTLIIICRIPVKRGKGGPFYQRCRGIQQDTLQAPNGTRLKLLLYTFKNSCIHNVNICNCPLFHILHVIHVLTFIAPFWDTFRIFQAEFISLDKQ